MAHDKQRDPNPDNSPYTPKPADIFDVDFKEMYRYLPEKEPRPYRATSVYATESEIQAWHKDAIELGFTKCNAAYIRFILNARARGDLVWMDVGLWRLLRRLASTLGGAFGELVATYEHNYLEGTVTERSSDPQGAYSKEEREARKRRWSSLADKEVDV